MAKALKIGSFQEQANQQHNRAIMAELIETIAMSMDGVTVAGLEEFVAKIGGRQVVEGMTTT